MKKNLSNKDSQVTVILMPFRSDLLITIVLLIWIKTKQIMHDILYILMLFWEIIDAAIKLKAN